MPCGNLLTSFQLQRANAADHPYVRMLDTPKRTRIRTFQRCVHLDLAGQAPADIQMLYYYIILRQELQGVSAIFFIFRKNSAARRINLHRSHYFPAKKYRTAALPKQNRRTDHFAYACSGAPTGHVSAQAPQSRQVSASITYLPSPSEIAPAGHASAQAPHWMQASLIAYAITVYLL